VVALVHHADVAQAADKFIALRFQLEDFESAQTKPFLKTFGIVGLPTVVHLVPDNGATRTASVR